MRAFRNSAANVAASLARRPICSLTIAEKNGQFAAKREWQSDGANPLHFSRSRSRGDDRNRRRKRVHLIVQTRKITTPAATRANSKSTLYADLADLTTPASVEPQTFSQCTGVDGPVLIRAMSRTGPGKSLHAVRRSSPPNTVENAEAQIRRHDLSFFFPDEAKTKKAARRCSGKEWAR